MASIAGLQDFRREGPPADIGTFEFPANTFVYQHTFGGTTYVCAVRSGQRGWVLIDYLRLTATNAVTVIEAAINALGTGRTWKEKVVVAGNYSSIAQVTLPDYTLLEIIGYWNAQNALNASLIINSDPTGGNTDIEIMGGTVDCNKGNQTVSISTIYFNNVSDSKIHNVKVIGGHRYDDIRGEGIELYNCDDCTVFGNFVSEADYDGIKLRDICTGCIVAFNQIICPTTGGSAGIQVASADTERNVIYGNTITCLDENTAGLKIHTSDYNTFAENTVYGGYAGIDFVEGASYNEVIGNIFDGAIRGVHLRTATPVGNTFAENTIRIPTGVAYGFDIEYGEDNIVWHNKIIGYGVNSIGISISADVLRTELHHNDFLGSWGTRVSDGGTDTRFDTITAPFAFGSDPQVGGWQIDLAGEQAATWVHLPKHVHEIVSVKVWARVLEADADKMRGDLQVCAGADNEAWDIHGIAFTDEPTITENFAADDMIHWRLTHATITLMGGGDDVYIRIQHEDAGNGDVATNCRVRSVEIEYI